MNTTESNKLILEQFDTLLGADDLTALDQLCTPTWSTTPWLPDGRPVSPGRGSSSRPWAATR